MKQFFYIYISHCSAVRLDKNINFDNRSGHGLFLLFVSIKPAFENKRSQGTDVAGIDKYLIATGYKFGYLCFTSFQYAIGLIVLGARGSCKKRFNSGVISCSDSSRLGRELVVRSIDRISGIIS